MEELNPGTIAALGGLLGGIILGFAARWGRFCTLSAIEAVALGGDSRGVRMWGLAIALAVGGSFALDHAGLINLSNSFYVASPASIAATIVGSFVFGLGMAFVGACGYGTLARIGGGDLKSFVTFLVMGVAAYATLSGVTAYLRVGLFPKPANPEHPASFAHLLANVTGISLHVCAYTIALLLAVLCLSSAAFRNDPKKIFTGLLVGLVVVSGWVTTGIIAADEFEPYPLESFTFSAPLGETIMYVMTMSGAPLKFGIGAVFGVIVGAAITSVAQGHFRWEACDDAREMRRQILGGILMGVGGVTALGCTIGQGISAASTLAFSAPIALVSIFAGAWLGLQYLIRGSFTEPFREFFAPK